jgi:thiamine-monophosphate kinase
MERESQLVEKIARALSAGATSKSSTKRDERDLSAATKQGATARSRAINSSRLSSQEWPPSGRRERSFRSQHHVGPADPSALRLGIGDDAAILAPAGRSEWVITCDAFLEGVHFLAKTHPADSVGYKSLVRATSDLAAMGATPRFFLLTLALPLKFSGAIGFRQGTASAVPKNQNRFGALAPEVWLKKFLHGMARAACELGITIIGGDTTKGDRIFISITALGEIAPGCALTRSGANPGDMIYVSGKVGRAALGLELVLRGLAGDRRYRGLTQPHFYPKIRVALGSWLARHHIASSAMDISDGLSSDIGRLCGASQVGAKIYADKIPSVVIPAAAAQKLGKRKLDPLQLALHGGEDYELLFTIPPSQVKKLRNVPGASELTAIGEVTRNKRIVLVSHDSSHAPLRPGGWDPFRAS